MGKTVCIIPARGGSKGVPGKNIRPLQGVPLVAHSILQANAASAVDAVYVTSDDASILAVAEKYGATPILRPEAISGDTASSESALLHALEVIEKGGEAVSLVVFLQCTSPVRALNDIDNAVATLRAEGADSLLSVVNSHRFFWEKTPAGAKSVNYDYKNRPRRQDMSPQYQENGSIYIFTPTILKQHRNRLGGSISLYEMEESSNVDIDTEHDFLLAQSMIAQFVTAENSDDY